MKSALQKNIEYSNKYHQKIDGFEIPSMISRLINNKKIKNILDLGCGDGGIISAIDKKYKNKNLYGVDISPRRIRDLKQRHPRYNFLCRNALNTGLPSNYFDLVICTQVIEHVEDDKKLVDEIYRILKPFKYLYISSVIKKPWAIYKYRNKGKFVLDPTHIREYKSKEEFVALFKGKFKLLKVIVSPVKRKKIITFKIPGYFIIESLWRKN